jgi:hypothetical protein
MTTGKISNFRRFSIPAFSMPKMFTHITPDMPQQIISINPVLEQILGNKQYQQWQQTNGKIYPLTSNN